MYRLISSKLTLKSDGCYKTALVHKSISQSPNAVVSDLVVCGMTYSQVMNHAIYEYLYNCHFVSTELTTKIDGCQMTVLMHQRTSQYSSTIAFDSIA